MLFQYNQNYYNISRRKMWIFLENHIRWIPNVSEQQPCEMSHQSEHICWHGSFEMKRLSADGVCEIQFPGMKRLPGDADIGRNGIFRFPKIIRIVERVSEERVSNMSHMYADLMRAPGLEPEGEDRAAGNLHFCEIGMSGNLFTLWAGKMRMLPIWQGMVRASGNLG